MEILFDALTEALDGRRDVLEPARIAVPNRAMERAIEVHIAQRRGMAQNLRFERIDGLTSALLEARAERAGLDPDARLAATAAEPARWEALLLAVLHDERLLDRTDLSPVSGWLGDAGEARQTRVVSLAARLSELVSQYDRKRPELVRAWVRDASAPPSLGLTREALAFHERWQRALVKAAREKGPAPFSTELLDALATEAVTKSDEPLHVIGLSHASRAIMNTLRAFDRERPLTVYALDPCREFWEDVESGPEEARRMRRSSAGSVAAPSSTEGDATEAIAESALLSAWGRAGREHLAELHELSAYDSEERFEDEPEGVSALEEVQRSILERRPAQVQTEDASLLLLPCPSVRRELEVVASEIWSRIDQGARFSDIAVLLHEGERERYLPLLPSVFTEARELPWSAVDVPFVWRSRIAAGALRLVASTTTEITRSRLLDLLFHPNVHAQMPEARASAWSAMLDRLGFFRGLSASPGAASGDLGQALERLAIGAVSAGERSGNSAPIGPFFPEEIDAAADESGGLYRILRSLGSDLAFARRAELSLRDWARFFGAMLDAYLVPQGTRDEADLLRVRATLLALERRHIEGTRYRAKVAESIFTRELSRQKTEVGAPLLSGVTVSTLVPMRALPFAHVFVLGLGEGRFAGGQEERGLDLTRGARQFGDVEDSERDRYTFLETLLSARESLTISWVARDEATGDPIPPASVVSELVAALGKVRTVTPPLRRHEDDARGPIAMDALVGAAEERRARRLGDAEREELSPEGARGASLAISAFASLVQPDDPRRALLTWDALGALPTLEAPAVAGAAPARLGPAPARLGPAPARLGPAPARLAARPIPASAAATPMTRVPELRVRLEEVRSFLERPMQTAAEHALGQSRGPSRDRIDEPPVTVSKAQEARLLREAVRRALAQREVPLRVMLNERARRERARGLLPEGALGERAVDALEESLRALLDAMRQALGAATTSAISAVRFGPGRTLTELTELPLPALDLGRSVRADRVVLHGESHGWLADQGRAMVIVDPFAQPLSGDRRARTRVAQQLLRAFVDHAALAASTADAAGKEMGRTVHVVSPTGACKARFLPMPESVARAWLLALADELTKGHAAFLPGEVVLGESDRIRRSDAGVLDALERALDKARAKDDRLLELYGPVRDARERPGPQPGELMRVLGRRFGPFFEHVQIDEPMRRER